MLSDYWHSITSGPGNQESDIVGLAGWEVPVTDESSIYFPSLITFELELLIRQSGIELQIHFPKGLR